MDLLPVPQISTSYYTVWGLITPIIDVMGWALVTGLVLRTLDYLQHRFEGR